MNRADPRLMAATQKIVAALNDAETQGFIIILDEDGDHAVTVWSADREDFSEAVPTNDGWVARSA